MTEWIVKNHPERFTSLEACVSILRGDETRYTGPTFSLENLFTFQKVRIRDPFHYISKETFLRGEGTMYLSLI